MSDAPVRLCCGRRHHGAQCPDGLVMCCLCFGRFPIEQLSWEDGHLVDVCQSCAKEERTPAQRIAHGLGLVPADKPGYYRKP